MVDVPRNAAAADVMSPFTVAVPQADLDDLAARLAGTRWAGSLPDGGLGVPPDELRELAEYWADGYDWRAQEAWLNTFPQVTTTIDGQRVHALHVRSPEPDAVALVLSHGWPGSIVEFGDVIGPLTDPRAHGGDPRDAFHVIAPSLPGYGFSGPTDGAGWDVDRIARCFATLVHRLGHDRYGAQGGDWGSAISRQLARVDPEHVLGVHLNMLGTRPPADPSTDAERDSAARAERYQRDGSGYAHLQSTRPQTLSYGLTDSPVGQLAWIVEKFDEWTDASQGRWGGIDRDRLLTNVMLYWLTGTAGSSARLYAESWRSFGSVARSEVPTGVAVFPADIMRPIRALAEEKDNVVHWTEMAHGGHFAAMEQPALLVEDVRAFFRPLR